MMDQFRERFVTPEEVRNMSIEVNFNDDEITGARFAAFER